MRETLQKQERIVDWDLLYKIRSQGCIICNRRPADCSHIRSRGAGGPDTDWNVCAMCRIHHSEWHQIGWRKFFKKYPAFHWHLESRGWLIEYGKLWHPQLGPVDPHADK